MLNLKFGIGKLKLSGSEQLVMGELSLMILKLEELKVRGIGDSLER